MTTIRRDNRRQIDGKRRAYAAIGALLAALILAVLIGAYVASLLTREPSQVSDSASIDVVVKDRYGQNNFLAFEKHHSPSAVFTFDTYTVAFWANNHVDLPASDADFLRFVTRAGIFDAELQNVRRISNNLSQNQTVVLDFHLSRFALETLGQTGATRLSMVFRNGEVREYEVVRAESVHEAIRAVRD